MRVRVGRASTAPTCCSCGRTTRRRPALRPTSPGWSWPARWWHSAPMRRASPRATGSWRWSAAAARPSWRPCTSAAAMPVPDALDWPAGGRRCRRCSRPPTTRIFTQAALRPGEHLLVHGAAGGVGTAAVQLGRAAGARVTATVRREELRPRVEELGARVIAPEGFDEHGPFDVVLELVGAGNLAENLQALATGGRIAVIGVGGSGQGGAQPARADGQARPHPRLDPAHAPARGEGDRDAAGGAGGAAAVRGRAPGRAGRRHVPARRGRGRPTSASRPAASSARSCCFRSPSSRASSGASTSSARRRGISAVRDHHRGLAHRPHQQVGERAGPAAGLSTPRSIAFCRAKLTRPRP